MTIYIAKFTAQFSVTNFLLPVVVEQGVKFQQLVSAKVAVGYLSLEKVQYLYGPNYPEGILVENAFK